MGVIHVWWLLSRASSPNHNPTAAAKAFIPEALLLHEAFQAFICVHTRKPKSLTSSALLPPESIVSTPLTSYIRLSPAAKGQGLTVAGVRSLAPCPAHSLLWSGLGYIYMWPGTPSSCNPVCRVRHSCAGSKCSHGQRTSPWWGGLEALRGSLTLSRAKFPTGQCLSLLWLLSHGRLE